MLATLPTKSAVFPPIIRQAMCEAAIEFFSEYCHFEDIRETNIIDTQSCPGIMGTISYIGTPMWSFTIVMPEHTAVAAAHNFLGMELPFSSPDMGDMVQEIANVLAGVILPKISELGPMQMSLPSVMRGHDVEMLTPGNMVRSSIRFVTGKGNLWFHLFSSKS